MVPTIRLTHRLTITEMSKLSLAFASNVKSSGLVLLKQPIPVKTRDIGPSRKELLVWPTKEERHSLAGKGMCQKHPGC